MAFVVGLFVSLGWAVAMVAAAVDDDVSSAGVQLLAALGGVLAGSVAAYLGAATIIRWHDHGHDDDEGDG